MCVCVCECVCVWWWWGLWCGWRAGREGARVVPVCSGAVRDSERVVLVQAKEIELLKQLDHPNVIKVRCLANNAIGLRVRRVGAGWRERGSEGRRQKHEPLQEDRAATERCTRRSETGATG